MMIKAIVAILGGLMASYSLIVSKKPETREYLDKIRPYQEWLGVFLTIWGLFGVLNMVLKFDVSLMGLALFGAEFVVGFLLAYPLIMQYVLKNNETAEAKGVELRQNLLKFQIPAGIALIILGILSLLKSF